MQSKKSLKLLEDYYVIN
jgi:hypothetical protein